MQDSAQECCVLHNMFIRAGVETPPIFEELEDSLSENISECRGVSTHMSLLRGQRARERLVQLIT